MTSKFFFQAITEMSYQLWEEYQHFIHITTSAIILQEWFTLSENTARKFDSNVYVTVWIWMCPSSSQFQWLVPAYSSFKAVDSLGTGDWLMENLLFVFCERSSLLYLLSKMKGPLPWAVQTCTGCAVRLSCHCELQCLGSQEHVFLSVSFVRYLVALDKGN